MALDVLDEIVLGFLVVVQPQQVVGGHPLNKLAAVFPPSRRFVSVLSPIISSP